MGIKDVVKANCPEFLLPLLRMPYRAVKAALRIREIEHRALKYLPYYQDELSREALYDHLEFYRTGDRNVFLKYAERIGMRFWGIENLHSINIEDTRGGDAHSGIVVVYEHESKDLEYTCRLLSLSDWAEKYRSITLKEFLGGREISGSELAVPVLTPAGNSMFDEHISKNNLKFAVFRGLINSVREDLQYFDVFGPLEDEVIVDAGCYNGKTAIQFLEWGKEKVRHVYSFEFDPINADVCEENLKPYSDKVTLIRKGTWDKEDIVRINASGNEGSSVRWVGDVEVQLAPIDSEVKDEKVTLIKMDIEGAELKALMGAKNIIQKYHPRLIICMYHKREDLYELPGYILSLVPEYKFYMRHYNSREYGTILYAYCE